MVSITRIEASDKIRTAKIFVTVMGSDEDRSLSIETLQEHVHDIQKHVQKNLRMRYIPRLSVHEDQGFYKMLDMERKFQQISEERQVRERSLELSKDKKEEE